MNKTQTERRGFLKTAGAALTTSIFTGKIRGANGKVNAAFIGTGARGTGNIHAAMQQENLVVSAVCDVYQPNLERGVAASCLHVCRRRQEDDRGGAHLQPRGATRHHAAFGRALPEGHRDCT